MNTKTKICSLFNIMLCSLLISTLFFTGCAAEDRYQMIELEYYNIAFIKGPINAGTVDITIKELYSIKNDTIYIYLDTPGGSVIDGNEIIDAIETLTDSGKNIICIADTAISMGFVIFQHCPSRFIRPRAILMQHQMSGGVQGPFENLKSRLEFFQDLDNQLTEVQATRLQLNPEEFKIKTNNDWWLYGKSIIKNHAADEMVRVKCNFDYEEETFSVDQMTMFGQVELTFSKCPLMKVPLSITMNGMVGMDKMNRSSFDTISDLYNYIDHDSHVEEPWKFIKGIVNYV